MLEKNKFMMMVKQKNQFKILFFVNYKKWINYLYFKNL